MSTAIESDRHRCAYPWCDVNYQYPREPHFGAQYTTATRHPIDTGTHEVGVVLDYDEGRDPVPYLSITVRRIDSDDVADAGLSIDEAITLRDILDTAISHVAGFDTEIPR